MRLPIFSKGESRLRAEIVAVGTELLLGQIVNTNAQFLSEELAKLGIDVHYQTVVGDNRKRLEHVIRHANGRADVIILSGGLGPTDDDLTREVVSEVTGVPLVMHPPSLSRLKDFFERRGRIMTENNRKQALVFKGGTVFPNENGTAPGLAVEANARHYVLLPGPPRELKPMFRKHVIPYFRRLLPSEGVVHSRVLRFFGIGESQLETDIMDLIHSQDNPTIAPLAKEGEVTLRLTAKAASVAEAEALIERPEREIRRRVGQYLYGTGDVTLAEVVVKRLTALRKTVALAESCTGGLVANMITSVPGSSEAFLGGYVCYSGKAKREWLGIPAAVLEEHGTVSEQTARWLAEKSRARISSDYGIGVTGVAGPDRVEDKPVGLVYVSLASPGKETVVKPLQLTGLRETIQVRAAKHALYLLYQHLI